MSPLTPAERVAAYVRLRDYKRAAEEEFKKSLSRVVEAMNKLEAELLNDLDTVGGNSLACDGGTVYKRIELSATVENREAFLGYCADNSVWEAMDIKANKTFVKDFMERNGASLPGVKVTQMATVGVRRS
jgi:hypothetical protein